MAGIATGVGTNILTDLVKTGIHEIQYLCCFKNVVRDFEEKRDDLVARRRTVEGNIKNANRRNEDITPDVDQWVKKADSLIGEDSTGKKNCFHGWFPNYIWRYRQGKSLERKKQEVVELLKCKFPTFALPSKISDIERLSSEDFVRFESRDEAYKELLQALEDGDYHMIGLYGMPGSGKTTLAMEVGRKVEELKLFDYVLTVVVSNVPDTAKKIQDQIGSCLNLKWDNENERDRANSLWKRLTSEDKVLIILDDVWEELKFKEIGIPMHKSCYVLLTTRNLEVCNKMECQPKIQLEVLSDPEAWALFQKCAKLDQNSSRTMKNKGQQIAKLCKGLPLAIVAIASILKNEEIEEWNAALKSLNRTVHNMDKDLERVYRPLEVSYNYLQSEAKELFKLCSVFPEDYQILVEDLITFGIGLGLCGEVNSYGDKRDIVRKALKKIINSCLLSRVDNGKFVKMHDLVRDAAHCIAKKAIHVAMDPKTLKELQEDASVKGTLRHLYWHVTNELPEQLDCPKIEFLILEFGYQSKPEAIPDTFFKGMKDLKVCFIYGYYRWETLLLPKSLESLNNLKNLGLRKFEVDGLFVLEKLESLELDSCTINELPNGVVKLKKLKLLRLTNCEIHKNPFGVINKLSQLEELYFMGNVLSYSQVSIEDVAIPSLQRYHIELTPGAILQESVNDSMSRALSFACFDGSPSNATIKNIVQTAEVLHLYQLQGGWTTITPHFVGAIGEMNDLMELKLRSCSEIMFLIDGTALSSSQETLFSNIAKLSLEDMDKLEELCHNLPLSDTFERLQELVIRQCPHLNSRLFSGKLKLCQLKILCVENCPKLTSLFTISVARSLVLLEELKLKECEALECIIKEKSDEGKGKEIVVDDDNQMRSFSMFPGLKKLKILRVEYCPKLISLFTLSVAKSLVLLKELQIKECESLKCIIDEESDEGKGKEIVEDDDDHIICSPLFQKSKRLVIGCCQQSGHKSSVGSKRRKGKEILKVEDDQMRSFSLFPELKEMVIDSCQQLEQILSVGSTKSWNKVSLLEHTPPMELQAVNSQRTRPFDVTHYLLCYITKMKLVKCEKLTSLFNLSVAPTMLLEELTIKGCHGLRHIITNERDHKSHMNDGSILPKLKLLRVEDCSQLIYVIGEYHHEIHLSTLNVFPALEELHLSDMPNIKNIFPNNDHPRCSALRELDLIDCPLFSITSITDFKDFGENMKQAHTLNVLIVINSEIKGVICLEGNSVNGQLGIEVLYLHNLADLSCTFSGPKRTLSLTNLRDLEIEGCGKLKFIFSTTVLKSLPQLYRLAIVNCDALEQIVEEDYENENLSNPHNSQEVYFPQLEFIWVINCRKLKRLFWMNSPCEFPELVMLFIAEASNLEEVFGSSEKAETEEQVDNVLPNLERLYLAELPSLANLCQWTRLQNVERVLVLNCPKISLTSTTTLQWIIEEWKSDLSSSSDEDNKDKKFGSDWVDDIILKELICLENRERVKSEAEAALERELHSSQKQSITELDKNIVGEVGAPEIPPATSSSTDLQVTKMPSTSTSTAHLAETTSEGQPLATGETKKLVDKESKSETEVKTDQEAFGKTGSDRPSNESQNRIKGSAEEVTMSDKGINLNSITPDLTSRISATDSQDLVREGLNEPVSMGAPEKGRNTGGTPQFLDQNSNLAQNPSLQNTAETVEQIVLEIQNPSPAALQKESAESIEGGVQEISMKASVDDYEKSPETLEETKEAPQRCDKPSNVLQKTSLQRISGSAQRASLTDLKAGTLVNPQQEFDDTESMDVPIFMGKGAIEHASATASETIISNKTTMTRSLTIPEPKDSALIPVATSLQKTSPLESVEKGSNEPVSHDSPEVENGSVNETGQRLEKSSETSLQGPMRVSKTETYLDKDTNASSSNLQDLMDGVFSVLDSMEKDGEVQGSLPSASEITSDRINLEDHHLLAKAFADLEAYLKMPLKDIANSEVSRHCLENALKFLSSWSYGNAAPLEGLKAKIDSLLQNMPSILSSFKQASATIEKFTMLDKRQKSIKEELPGRKEAASNLEKSIAEAQRKEVTLREKFYRLLAELKSTEDEIKENEVQLSSLKEEGKTLNADTVNFLKEFETIKKDKSEMVEDPRKAQQELFKASYEWLDLCNQLMQSCNAARNLF